MSTVTHTPFNIGTTSQLVIPANPHRLSIAIQNKHATQTLWAKFGAAVVGTDVVQTETISFGATPTAGAWALTWNGNATASLAFNIIASALQTALQAVTGLGSVTVSGSVAAGFVVTMTSVTLGFSAQLPLLTVSSNTLSAPAAAVTVAVTTQGAFADGFAVVAANGSLVLSGAACPIGSLNLLASGANTRAEVMEGN